MAHTYVIQSAVSDGSVCTINGTVDGFSVNILVPMSLITAQPNATALQNLIAPLMLLAAQRAGLIASPSVVSVTTLGMFSQ